MSVSGISLAVNISAYQAATAVKNSFATPSTTPGDKTSADGANAEDAGDENLPENTAAAEIDVFSRSTASDAYAKQARYEMAMMKIAMRLSHGDKVPPEDEKALAEYNSKLYITSKSAGAMRRREDTEEYDSALEESEEGENSDVPAAVTPADSLPEIAASTSGVSVEPAGIDVVG